MGSIENYCNKYSEKESLLLKKIKKFTQNHEPAPQMISGHTVTNILKMYIRSLKAKCILEVGMFTGYSALAMAEATGSQGKIHTCEIMKRHIQNAKNFFKNSKYANQITVHEGDALISLNKFKNKTFDFIFIDADKINYIKYYEKCMKLLKSKGMIVLDNMLWGGSVLNPKDEQSTILNKLATIINNDKRNQNILLPIRDGLMVCFKK